MCFQIERTSGLWFSAEYSSFSVGPETDKYRLSVAGYIGDAGDAIAAPVVPGLINNGMMFSTPDQDNDPHPARSAREVPAGGITCAEGRRSISITLTASGMPLLPS